MELDRQQNEIGSRSVAKKKYNSTNAFCQSVSNTSNISTPFFPMVLKKRAMFKIFDFSNTTSLNTVFFPVSDGEMKG